MTSEQDARRGGTGWHLPLHPVGRRGAALAVVAFAVVLASRLPGLASPPQVYFDETSYGPSAAELAAGNRLPAIDRPFPADVRALSLWAFGRPTVGGSGTVPDGVAGRPLTEGGVVVWLPSGGGDPQTGRIDGCSVEAAFGATRSPFRGTALGGAGGSRAVAGIGPGGPVLIWTDGVSPPSEIVPLPEEVETLAALRRGLAFAVTTDGTLLRVEGSVRRIAEGADDVVAVPSDDLAWVSFPDRGLLRAYDEDGSLASTVRVPGVPGRLAVPVDPQRGITPHAVRILAADREGDRVHVVDPFREEHVEALAIGADRFATTAGGYVWAADGDRIRLIEPRGPSVIGSATVAEPVDALVPHGGGEGVLAVSGTDATCVGARPAFAMRLGSAVTGAAIAGLVLLLALRLFGSPLVGLLAASFVGLEGLTFVASRLAMNDTYVTAFIVAAWFCALTALRRRRDGGRGLGWLIGAGTAIGFGAASKWSAFFAVAAIVAVLLWDEGRRGGRSGIRGVAPLLAVTLVAVPAVAYVASYAPYFALGQPPGAFVQVQEGIVDYATTTRIDWRASPWYGWLVGAEAIPIYIGPEASRPEIWMLANPVVLIGGLAGVIALGIAGLRRRAAGFLLVGAAAAVQLLPFAVLPRPAWIYHYLPVVPFLALGLAWLASRHIVPLPRWTRWLQVTVAVAVAAAVFGATLPLLDGWAVSEGYREAIRSALPWMFR